MKHDKTEEGIGGQKTGKSNAIRLAAYGCDDDGLRNKEIIARVKEDFGIDVSRSNVNNVLGPEGNRTTEGSVLVRLNKLVNEIVAIAGIDNAIGLIEEKREATNGNS